MSIAFEFFAFTSLKPREYNLVLAVFYEDDNFEYATTVMNQPVKVLEHDQNIDAKGFLSILMTLALLFLGGFVAYVKLTDRFGNGEKRKKKREDATWLDKLRDLISS